MKALLAIADGKLIQTADGRAIELYRAGALLSGRMCVSAFAAGPQPAAETLITSPTVVTLIPRPEASVVECS